MDNNFLRVAKEIYKYRNYECIRIEKYNGSEYVKQWQIKDKKGNDTQ